MPELVKALPAERKDRRAFARIEGALPRFSGFNSIAGAEDQQIGDHAQCGQMFNWLVGRAIFAKPDGIMRHDIDGALAHQR